MKFLPASSATSNADCATRPRPHHLRVGCGCVLENVNFNTFMLSYFTLLQPTPGFRVFAVTVTEER